MTEHRDLLRERFLERVLALRPESVLDVGSGAGELVGALRDHGVRAHGVEPAPRHPHAGLCGADGARLPFADASFDWVAMNHVPHHLERPAAVFAEGWRVARLGLAVAEPWYDLAAPSQRVAERFDRWAKRQDRNRGMFHADILSADALTALLPDAGAAIEVETWRPDVTKTVDEVRHFAAEALGDRNPTPADAVELADILAATERGEVTQQGTLILIARR